jgi:hypothetical protein
MKRGIQISFAWLFAIIAGAFILFLAIYGITKFIGTEQAVTSAETGKEIGILLNPLETGFESAKTTSLSLPIESRIYNTCDTTGYFGTQSIGLSQKSFNKWVETDFDIGFYNKYLFSDEFVEGKDFYLFSKPFDFPFKIADLTYITSSKKDYCFLDPPEDIEEELTDLEQKNFFLEDCPGKSVKICFSDGSECDIEVNYNQGYVEKRGERVYFETDALMYAAIFSEKDVYECQVKRLMQRTDGLALLYQDKVAIISRAGCLSELNLLALSNAANSLSSSYSLTKMRSLIVEDLDDKNRGVCKLW